MAMPVKKVLIVDDDPDITTFLQVLLEDEGYAVVTTNKGKDVELLLPVDLPRLIVLDVLLSGMDGRDIARKLKDSEATRHIPIIMISAHPSAETTALSSGADEFLAKPFDIYAFLALVTKHI